MAHRRILTAGRRRALFGLPDDEAVCAQHHTLNEADLTQIRRRRRTENRLGYALQLCALRFPGRLLQPGETIPEAMLRIVGDQLGEPWEAIVSYGVRRSTRYEHSTALQEDFGYRPFVGAARKDMVEWLQSEAFRTPSPSALAEAFVEHMRRAAVIVPAPTTVERLCATALVKAERRMVERLNATLEPRHKRLLDDLLVVPTGAAISTLGRLRRAVTSKGAAGFRDLITRIEELRALDLPPPPPDAPPARMMLLARACRRISLGHLSAMPAPRRAAYLFAFAHEQLAISTDEAIETADRMIGSLFKRAERKHAQALLDHRRAIADVVRSHARFGAALIEARDSGGELASAIERVGGWEALEQSAKLAEQLRKPTSAETLSRIEGEFPKLRRFGPLFLKSFVFGGTRAMRPLLDAIDRLRTMHAKRGRSLGEDAPCAFVKPSWKALVRTKSGINAKTWEIAVFAAIRDALRAGDLWVEGARRYRSFDAQILDLAALDAAEASGALDRVAKLDWWSAGPRAWLDRKRAHMNALLEEAERRAAAGTLPDAAMRDGKLSISPVRNTTPAAAKDLARRLYGLLPRLRLTDLVEEVDGWTGMAECFTHLKTNNPPKDRRLLYAALIADGLNLGLTRMADACAEASYWRLARLVDWHVRDETYERAAATLVDAQRTAVMARGWGGGATSSSDGQHFRAGGHGKALAETNAHYGTEPGVKFYTHISDQFPPSTAAPSPPRRSRRLGCSTVCSAPTPPCRSSNTTSIPAASRLHGQSRG